MDDVLHDLCVDDREVGTESRARDRAEPVDRLSRREEREVGSEQQLVLDAVLDRAHERLIEKPAPGHQRRDVGVDVRVTPDDRDRLVEPGVAEVGDHDLQLRVPQRDLVEQDRPCLQQRSSAREGRSLVDQHRQLEPLERLADAEEVGAERVDVLVDRAELAADETEVALHPLELVDRRAGGRVDRSEADQAGGIARHVRGDVVVRNDEARRRGVEGQDDRSIDVCERLA